MPYIPVMETKSTPERFKSLRVRLGWTQHDAAEHFNVRANTYARWERGEVNPSGTAVRLLENLEAQTQ